MTAARAPIAAAAKAQVETWKTLGATSGAQRALALGRCGPDLARAVLADLSPADLILLHQGAAPRGRFQTSSQPLSDLAQETPGAFDLILVDGVLEEGDLSDVRNRARNLHRLLAPGGVLAATIETLAAPLEGEARPFDILLFPHPLRPGEPCSRRPGSRSQGSTGLATRRCPRTSSMRTARAWPPTTPASWPQDDWRLWRERAVRRDPRSEGPALLARDEGRRGRSADGG